LNLSDVNKILIIRLSSLGDVLLSTPLVRSIKKAYPQIQIDFILKEQYRDLYKLNPYINSLITYHADSSDQIKNSIKQNNYDVIIDLQNNFRSAALLKGVNAKVFKFSKRSLDKFLLVNFKINRLKDAPSIAVRYSESVPQVTLDDEGLDIFTDKKPSTALSPGEKFIGLAPGSRHFTKSWPKDYYASLGKRLNLEGYKVVLFGGEDDKDICNEIMEGIEACINLCSANDILQIAADMKMCKAVVCNDSGLMHTACAAGVPVLSIFGSTVKEFGFFPYNNRNLVLENKLLSCRPCSHIGRSRCPRGHFKCMLEITPGETYNKLMELLS
jgi:lipopolysaccharide heptosyltransferase II